MELEQLRQFDAIARQGTMSTAARTLHLSQPALSHSLARLEARSRSEERRVGKECRSRWSPYH